MHFPEMAEDEANYLTFLLEQYRSLSASGSQTDRHTYLTVQISTAAVAAIAAAVIARWGVNDAAVESGLFLVVPAITCVGFLYWVGESTRMRRVFAFVCLVEEKIDWAIGLEFQAGEATPAAMRTPGIAVGPMPSRNWGLGPRSSATCRRARSCSSDGCSGGASKAATPDRPSH